MSSQLLAELLYDQKKRNPGLSQGAAAAPEPILDRPTSANYHSTKHQPVHAAGVTVELKDYIREIADFPKEGILYRDITPLLKDAAAFDTVLSCMADICNRLHTDAVASIESRGFLFAAPLAHHLAKPLVPIRKQGKLPYSTHTVSYTLEYGSDSLEVHTDAFDVGQRIVIVDDLLATGGSLAAAVHLVETAGASVAGVIALIELTELGGRAKLRDYETYSIIEY